MKVKRFAGISVAAVVLGTAAMVALGVALTAGGGFRLPG